MEQGIWAIEQGPTILVNNYIRNIELIHSRFHCTCAGEFGHQICRDTLEQNRGN